MKTMFWTGAAVCAALLIAQGVCWLLGIDWP